MVSDAAVLGARFPVPTIAGPDYLDYISAKRRKLVGCSSERSHAGRYSFDLAALRRNFGTSWSPVGSLWHLMKGSENILKIAR
jgi:hypothetical protein